jgi:hypothetical protein
MEHDPALALGRVRCPVLALKGTGPGTLCDPRPEQVVAIREPPT